MNKVVRYISIGLIAFFIFSFFFKNKAEADAKKSYESFLASKAIIIDVREESEVNEGMIKGAVWVPLSKLEANSKKEIDLIKKMSTDKQIFIYCRSGNRSGKAQSILKEAGVVSVNLGGYSGLVKESLPTQPGP